jgi:hypothetical protein
MIYTRSDNQMSLPNQATCLQEPNKTACMRLATRARPVDTDQTRHMRATKQVHPINNGHLVCQKKEKNPFYPSKLWTESEFPP